MEQRSLFRLRPAFRIHESATCRAVTPPLQWLFFRPTRFPDQLQRTLTLMAEPRLSRSEPAAQSILIPLTLVTAVHRRATLLERLTISTVLRVVTRPC